MICALIAFTLAAVPALAQSPADSPELAALERALQVENEAVAGLRAAAPAEAELFLAAHHDYSDAMHAVFAAVPETAARWAQMALLSDSNEAMADIVKAAAPEEWAAFQRVRVARKEALEALRAVAGMEVLRYEGATAGVAVAGEAFVRAHPDFVAEGLAAIPHLVRPER